MHAVIVMAYLLLNETFHFEYQVLCALGNPLNFVSSHVLVILIVTIHALIVMVYLLLNKTFYLEYHCKQLLCALGNRLNFVSSHVLVYH